MISNISIIISKEIKERKIRKKIYEKILYSRLNNNDFFKKNRPLSIYNFYTYILPIFYSHSIIIILYIMRFYKKEVQFRYVLLMQVFASLVFSFKTEKLLFRETAMKEKAYSRLIINMHLEEKDSITDFSYGFYSSLDKKIKEKYEILYKLN